MKLLKIFRSNAGFSMVEISVAMGLLGLASLAVMNLTDQVATSTKRAETLLSKSQFASSLGGYMYSASACDELKEMSGFSQTPKDIVLNDWKVAGYNEGEIMKEIKSGKKFRNFTLKSLTGVLPDPAGLPIVTINSVNYTKSFLNIRAEVELKMNAKLQADDPAGKKSYEYFFNVPVLIDPVGIVSFCNEEKTVLETCLAMKGKFNDGKCDLEKTCNVQGTYAILNCTPSGQSCSTAGGDNTSNPISSGIYGLGCPPGVSGIVTGTKTWSHIGTCSGKKCSPPTVTDTLTYYACLQCPGLSGGGGGGGPTGGGGGGGPTRGGKEFDPSVPDPYLDP